MKTKYWKLMGKVIKVHKKLEREVYKDKATWKTKELKSPRFGWVVGKRTVYNGTISHPGHGGGSYFSEPEWEPGYLTQEESISHLLVSFSPYEKPVRVPLDGYEEGEFPLPKPAKPAWTEGARAQQREIMQDVPRDSKGRWLQ